MPIKAFSPLCAVLISLTAPAVLAEPPMTVDDAGTLPRGGKKIEFSAGRDDRTREAELVFGLAPIEHLELQVAAARGDDRSLSPSTRLTGAGLGVKWVPIQTEVGWSLGASLGLARTRVKDRATPDNTTERETVLTGLLSHRWASGQVMHANVGVRRTKVQGGRDEGTTWGLGYEHSLAQALKLTLEVYGEDQGQADKAVGLRYTLAEGFKLNGALGWGGGREFGHVGFAWEF